MPVKMLHLLLISSCVRCDIVVESLVLRGVVVIVISQSLEDVSFILACNELQLMISSYLTIYNRLFIYISLCTSHTHGIINYLYNI
jgi:hypothetical protein